MEGPSRSRMFREFMKMKRNIIEKSRVTLLSGSEEKAKKLIHSSAENKK